MTKKSREILAVLQNSEGHMTAEQVYLACRNAGVCVSVATVYRCLSVLADEGHVRRFSIAGEPEYFDKTVTAHEHLFCSRCRRVTDARAADVQKLLEETFGITLESYDLSMHVVCRDCREKKA